MKLLQEQTKWIMEQNNRRLRDRAVFRVELGPYMSMWERMQLDGKTVGKDVFQMGELALYIEKNKTESLPTA